jgi:hypothetical protein
MAVDGLASIDSAMIRRMAARWRMRRVKALSIDWLDYLDWH